MPSVIEIGQAPPIHRLDTLFKQLSRKRQRRIDELWEQLGRPRIKAFCQQHQHPSDLSNALARCGRSFENLRYYYEDPDRALYYIGDFAWVLLHAIVEIHPDWKPAEPLSGMLGG